MPLPVTNQSIEIGRESEEDSDLITPTWPSAPAPWGLGAARFLGHDISDEEIRETVQHMVKRYQTENY